MRWHPPDSALRLLANDGRSLESDVLTSLLHMMPIGVLAANDDKNPKYPIAYGIRSAQIARAHLGPDAHIPVTVHDKAEQGQIAQWRLLDRLVVPTLLGPRNGDELVNLWVQAFDSGDLATPEATTIGLDRIDSQRALQQLLNVDARRLRRTRDALRQENADEPAD